MYVSSYKINSGTTFTVIPILGERMRSHLRLVGSEPFDGIEPYRNHADLKALKKFTELRLKVKFTTYKSPELLFEDICEAFQCQSGLCADMMGIIRENLI